MEFQQRLEQLNCRSKEVYLLPLGPRKDKKYYYINATAIVKPISVFKREEDCLPFTRLVQLSAVWKKDQSGLVKLSAAVMVFS